MHCLANMCYVCLEKKTKSIKNINSSLSVNKDIIDIIGYPPFNLAWLKTKQIILICEECCLRLRETYQFLKMCLKNSALLQGYMDNLDTKEGELLVHLNIQHKDINPVKCEIKLEEEVINTIEPIIKETEDVSVDFEDPLVEEKFICKMEEVHLEEEYLMDNNSTESINNDKSDSKISTHVTNTERVHSDKKPYKCGICKKYFASKASLSGHMRCHTGEKPYKCSTCKRCFIRRSDLGRHMRIHTGEKPYECSRCQLHFRQKSNLVRHMQRHTGEKAYQCPRVFVDSEDALDEEKIICKVEEVHVKEEYLMDNNSTESINNDEEICTSKPIIEKTEDAFVGFQDPQGTGEKTYQQCNRVFVDSEDPLVEEKVVCKTKEVHVKEEYPIDNNSTESMNNESDLEIFANSNTNITNIGPVNSDKEPYKCGICTKCFASKSNLTRHMRIHTGEKPYDCSVCGKGSNTKADLDIHMRVHTGERPYECSVCKKKFITRSHLLLHMRLHTGEKPYECSICKKKFSARSHIVRHMRVHTGERPYECSICKKKFTTRSHLVRHIRLHTGEKPYQCTTCTKCFKQQSYLVRHMQIHTGEKT